jgi:hypothetical protein
MSEILLLLSGHCFRKQNIYFSLTGFCFNNINKFQHAKSISLSCKQQRKCSKQLNDFNTPAKQIRNKLLTKHRTQRILTTYSYTDVLKSSIINIQCTTWALDSHFHEKVHTVNIHSLCNGQSVPWEGTYCEHTQLAHWAVISMRKSILWTYTACAMDSQFHEKIHTVNIHKLRTGQSVPWEGPYCEGAQLARWKFSVTLHYLQNGNSVSGFILPCRSLNFKFREMGSILLLGRTGQHWMLLLTARQQTLLQDIRIQIGDSWTIHSTELNWFLFVNNAKINNEKGHRMTRFRA